MSKKSLPALTHLHYLVLGVLRPGEQPGRVLRQASLRMASGEALRRSGGVATRKGRARRRLVRASIVVTIRRSPSAAIASPRRRRGCGSKRTGFTQKWPGFPRGCGGPMPRNPGVSVSAPGFPPTRRRDLFRPALADLDREHIERGGFGWTYALRLTILWLRCVRWPR